MDLAPLVLAAMAAVAGLAGVALGSRLSSVSAKEAWDRDQRVAAYASVLHAVDRQFSAFGLLNSTLELGGYQLDRARRESVSSLMHDWGKWDHALDEALPSAELVASDDTQPWLSIRIKYGMRGRQRLLLMDLDYRQSVDEAEWKSVARMTLSELDEIRRALRMDLATRPTRRFLAAGRRVPGGRRLRRRVAPPLT